MSLLQPARREEGLDAWNAHRSGVLFLFFLSLCNNVQMDRGITDTASKGSTKGIKFTPALSGPAAEAAYERNRSSSRARVHTVSFSFSRLCDYVPRTFRADCLFVFRCRTSRSETALAMSSSNRSQPFLSRCFPKTIATSTLVPQNSLQPSTLVSRSFVLHLDLRGKS